MNNKFNISLAILQIINGILGAMLFFKSFLNYGEVTITMTILSFLSFRCLVQKLLTFTLYYTTRLYYSTKKPTHMDWFLFKNGSMSNNVGDNLNQ